MGMKVRWVGPYHSFLRIAEEMRSNKIDMVSLVTTFPGAESYVKFSETPIYKGIPALVFLKDHSIEKISKKIDIKGLRIAHFKFEEKYYFDIFKKNQISLSEVTGSDWFIRSLTMLLWKRVDAVYVPEVVPVQGLMKKDKFKNKFKIIHLPLKRNLFYTMFGKKMSNVDQVIQIYNATIKKSPYSYNQYLQKISRENRMKK